MKNFTKLISATVLAGACTAANAIPVSYVESQAQTQAGQVFNFNYDPILDSVGAGTLTIQARGDYTLGYPELENIGFNLDGVFTGITAPATGVVLQNYSYNDVLFETVFNLSAALMDAITASLSASLILDLDDHVDIFDGNSYVQATLAYEGASAVSEPGTLALLGLGLAGLGVVRKKKTV